MQQSKIFDIDSAPVESKPLLQNSIDLFGMIPNLHGVMAESPPTLEAYQRLHELAQKTAFDHDELTVVWQSINVEHDCHYCVPAHTMIAGMMKVAPEIIEALRNETELPTKRLNVLRETTLLILRKRGVVDDFELTAFFAVGFSRRHVMEIILILSQKVLSNYINHMAKTPLDKPFLPFEWKKNARPLAS
jgi:alkylhydroperoxidase family enzyme